MRSMTLKFVPIIKTYIEKGPFKYYLIKILTFWDPAQATYHQTLLIKEAEFLS